MDINNLIVILVIGALAGWLAGFIMKRRGLGIVGNIVVGIVGAVLGGYIFRLLGLYASGLLGTLIMATVGAVVLLFIIGIVKKA